MLPIVSIIRISITRNANGGGVVIYASKRYSCYTITELSFCSAVLEYVFLNLIINDVNCLVGCIYRPPISDIQLFLEKLTELLEVTRTNYPRHILIISGDFNLNILNCNTSVPCSKFVFLMYSNNLIPTILRPTRQNFGNTHRPYLDNFEFWQ